MKRYILLNPGPVNISEKVRRALLKEDLCHRENEFSLLLKGVRRKLLASFNIQRSYTACFFTASGTGALEAAVSSSLSQNGTILIINNGVYGERLSQISSIHGLKKKVISYPLGTASVISDIEKALKAGRSIEVVAMVHHETSTGMLNPVREVGALCKKYKKEFLLDAISALGGEKLDLEKDGISICVGTANKCIESTPGVSFVLIKKSLIRKLETYPKRTLYLDITSNLKEQEKGGTPFTPSVQSFYALDSALDELLKETVKKRIRRYELLSQLLRNGFKGLGLRFFLKEKYLSNTLTALCLPKKISYQKLHDTLKNNGFIIYAGQSKLKKKIFRIANMGQLTRKDMQRFLSELKQVLK